MRTAIGVYERAESALNRRRFVRTANGPLWLWELAFLLPTPQYAYFCHVRALKTDRTLQQLVADLVAARRAAAMTQEEVAARMWTTKSVVSRLESGVCTRPTLSTIEKYADAVGALVEIRVRIRR